MEWAQQAAGKQESEMQPRTELSAGAESGVFIFIILFYSLRRVG
jgi:hypothetical protein